MSECNKTDVVLILDLAEARMNEYEYVIEYEYDYDQLYHETHNKYIPPRYAVIKKVKVNK